MGLIVRSILNACIVKLSLPVQRFSFHSRMAYRNPKTTSAEDCLVSVITVVLNGERYIEDTIKSIVAQEYDNVEYIVIDGGSTDNTVSIIHKYDEYISTFVSEPDQGMYDAVNKGLRLAHGEIVAYLNADDQYLSNTIKEVVLAFNANPSLDYLYGSCIYIDNKKRELYEYKSIPHIRLLINNMKEMYWAQSSFFWRKKVHEKIGYFDDKLRYCGDYDFFARLIGGAFQGRRINLPLSLFMLHGDALSNRAQLAMESEYQYLCSKYRKKYNMVWRCLGELTFRAINIKAILKKYWGRLVLQHG